MLRWQPIGALRIALALVFAVSPYLSPRSLGSIGLRGCITWKMSTSDNSYYRLLFAFRECNKYDSVFLRALDELTDKVDFSWVKSCVAMGTGHGLHELQFAQRFLPNLQTFIAVEEDHESVKALRASLQVVHVRNCY